MNRKKIKIELCGNEYEIINIISVGDFIEIKKSLEDNTTDYKGVFANLICRKIFAENRPNINDIYSSDELRKCAEIYVNSDEGILKFYTTNINNKGFYEAVITSIYEQNVEMTKEQFEKNIPEMKETIISGISNVLESFSQSIINVVSSSMLENITKTTVHFTEMLRSVSSNIQRIYEGIEIPTISDEQLNKLKKSYYKWGSYGWTVLPNMPISYYNDCPNDIKDANKKALHYCKNKDMEELFKLLRNMKGVKKSDLEEAIFDFNHKQYKSCVLILFGLIDSKLIRSQKKDLMSERQRPSGSGAASFIYKKINDKGMLNNTVFLLLDCENLFSCLGKVFERGNDFRKQTDVINRNFVDHGMMTKKVTRMNCVQLFLLYYNLMNFLNNYI